jgi:two-component system phosphate regulon response regulator PhoB
MARIVVIEDEADLRSVLEYNLCRAGHQVTAAGTAAEGLRLVMDQAPDLVLLDLILPDLFGVDVCRMIKQRAATNAIPVMMLTARGEEQDRVTGLEAGAEDYLVKPFSMRELLLRIDVILGRGTRGSKETGIVEFGRLRFDRRAHRIWVDKQERSLTALEFRLFLALYDQRERVQSRSKLLRDVWKLDGEVVTRTVDTHVKRLREKLGPGGDYIETVRGVGYRFAWHPAQS